jgi:hypothetical protein
MATKRGIAVTRRALVQRLNRRLSKQGEVLKGIRGRGARSRPGEYQLIDIERNFLIEDDVNLEKLGRELGVLVAYERLVEE